MNSKQITEHLTSNAQQAILKTAELTEIERHLGYVGFIHHFKNYVIRGDDRYYNLAADSFDASIIAMNKLNALVDSPLEHHNLKILQETIAEYRHKLNIAYAQSNMLAITDLDKLVKVDDTQAEIALNGLNDKFIQDFFEQTKTTTDQARYLRKQTLTVSMLLIPVFLISTAYTLHLMRRLATSLKENQVVLFDLKTTQNELVEAEKMAALGGLVAGVAHEINTPLGIAITGISHQQDNLTAITERVNSGEVTLGDFKTYSSGAQKTYHLVLEHLNQAATLINNFKQVAVDQTNPDFRKIRVAPFINRLTSTFHPQIKHTNLKFLTKVEPDCELFTCPGALAQLLTILIQNSIVHAFKPSAKGTIEINGESRDEAVILKVIDDGEGVTSEHVAKLFEPFFTTKRSEGGSGLGLSIAHNIVTDVLKGRLHFEQNNPQGSQFIITLPRSV